MLAGSYNQYCICMHRREKTQSMVSSVCGYCSVGPIVLIQSLFCHLTTLQNIVVCFRMEIVTLRLLGGTFLSGRITREHTYEDSLRSARCSSG
jgi:hypothetical protein